MNCEACNEQLYLGTVVTALDKKWHAACFKCHYCRKQLGCKTFVSIGNKPMCLDCNRYHFMPTCKVCDIRIVPEVPHLIFEDSAFHAKCFICQYCSAELAECSFAMVNSVKMCLICKEKMEATATPE